MDHYPRFKRDGGHRLPDNAVRLPAFRQSHRSTGAIHPGVSWLPSSECCSTAIGYVLTLDAIRNDFNEAIRLGDDGVPLTGLNDLDLVAENLDQAGMVGGVALEARRAPEEARWPAVRIGERG